MIAVLSRPTHQHRLVIRGWLCEAPVSTLLAPLAVMPPSSSTWWSLQQFQRIQGAELRKERQCSQSLQQFRCLACSSCSTSFAVASLAPPTSPTPPMVGWLCEAPVSTLLAPLAVMPPSSSTWWSLQQFQRIQGAELRKERQCSQSLQQFRCLACI